MIERARGAFEERSDRQGAISALPVSIADALAVTLASAVQRALIHEGAPFFDDRAAANQVVASKLLVVNHICEKCVAGPVVVCRDEVSSLGHGEPVQVLRVAPVARDDLVFIRHVSKENLSRLAPELLTASKGQFF